MNNHVAAIAIEATSHTGSFSITLGYHRAII